MENFAQDYAYFTGQTAKMDIFAAAGTEAYARFRDFVIKSLTLLHGELEEPFTRWFEVARLAAQGDATQMQLVAARGAVEEYRRRQLGLNSFGAQRTDKNDALTVLFMFALEDWPSQPDVQSRTSIVQAIDEFSSLYIEFFGHGRDLVRVIEECFGIQ